MEAGRFAAEHAARNGKTAETFDFLGFTHYCGRSRNGKRFRIKRLTAKKKFVAKLHAFKEWLMESRAMKTAELWATVKEKLPKHESQY